jgi:uncharacterized protein (DUF433 family)
MTMEATHYIEQNKTGSIVVAGTDIHVSAVGFAHEDGSPEDDLLKRFSLTKEQLHGALAYFYGHREALLSEINKASELAQELSKESAVKVKKWREAMKR